MSATFVYETLRQDQNEVRLIELLPGTTGDPIRCYSHTRSLNNNLRYQALSYAWGEPADKGTIELCGHEFNVSTSLLSALRNLRYQHEPRILWIDALSINQNNDSEKAWQVGLMGTIFRSCEEGLLWIGDEFEQDDAWFIVQDKDHYPMPNYVGFDKTIRCTASHPHLNELSNRSHHWTSDTSTKLRGRWRYKNSARDQVHSYRWHEFQPQISTLLDLVHELGENKHLFEIPTLYRTAWTAGSPTIHHLEPIIALGAFMNRSWWTRMWTVQEAALPPVSTLCWGSTMYPLSEMATAASKLYAHSKTCCSSFFTALMQKLEDSSCGEVTVNALFKFQKHLHALDMTRRRLREPHTRINLMDCLYNFHDRQSKDPRDKIFALLGLLPEESRIRANYLINTDALYEKMSFLLLKSQPDRSLSVLWKESEPTTSDTAHSWVKNFNEEAKSFNRRARSEHYDASDGRPVNVKKINSAVISLLGSRIGGVSEVAHNLHVASTYSLNQFSAFRDWAQFLRLEHRHNEPYPAGGTLFDAFTRALTGDLHELHPEYLDFTEEEVERFMQALLDEELENALINTVLAQELNTSASGRRLFVTKQGLIGLGPEWMQPEDEVWLLFGGSVPFILRPVQNQESCKEGKISSIYHTVVGDCYVQGVMFGEAPKYLETEQWVFLK